MGQALKKGWTAKANGATLHATYLEGVRNLNAHPALQEPDYVVEHPLYTTQADVVENATRVHLQVWLIPDDVDPASRMKPPVLKPLPWDELETRHRKQSAIWIQEMMDA